MHFNGSIHEELLPGLHFAAFIRKLKVCRQYYLSHFPPSETVQLMTETN